MCAQCDMIKAECARALREAERAAVTINAHDSGPTEMRQYARYTLLLEILQRQMEEQGDSPVDVWGRFTAWVAGSLSPHGDE